MSVTRVDRCRKRASHIPLGESHYDNPKSLGLHLTMNMSFRGFSLMAISLVGLFLAVACTRPSQNPEEIREKTAQATADVKADATAVAQGVKEGLTRGNKVDLNNATKDQLMALPGINETAADRIIANRPYAAPEDLVKKKVLTPHEYDRISGQVGVK